MIDATKIHCKKCGHSWISSVNGKVRLSSTYPQFVRVGSYVQRCPVCKDSHELEIVHDGEVAKESKRQY